MIRLFKGKSPIEDNGGVAHAFVNFAGISANPPVVLSCLNKFNREKHDWIIDTGASEHMSPILIFFLPLKLYKNLYPLPCLMVLNSL